MLFLALLAVVGLFSWLWIWPVIYQIKKNKENSAICLLLLPSVLVLLVLAFKWTLMDLVTPFLFLPILWFAWFLLALSTIVSLILLLTKGRARKAKYYLPLIGMVITCVSAECIPFSDIWLNIDFRMCRAEREQVSEDIFAGKIRPNIAYNQSLIALPPAYQGLSKGGGEVLLLKFGNDTGVYFFAFRGILGSSSGYIYMNSDAVPKADDIFEVRKIAPRWFFIETD